MSPIRAATVRERLFSGLGRKTAPSRSRLGLEYRYARILSIGRHFPSGLHFQVAHPNSGRYSPIPADRVIIED